jgi:ABC-type lipoprotein export system ATPase subunit
MNFKSNDKFIVWVLGASGAGKATLISDLVSSDSTKWFSNLINTTNSNLFAVKESLQYVGQFLGDCIEKKVIITLSQSHCQPLFFDAKIFLDRQKQPC